MSTIDSQHLKAAMDLAGWQKVKFAEELGISISYLSDILSGRSRLERRPDLIKRMAELCGVPKTMIEYRPEASV